LHFPDVPRERQVDRIESYKKRRKAERKREKSDFILRSSLSTVLDESF